ncbi:gamma-glutamyltransferase [Steroidobacter flavus]|uniref:Gamma-glutamyltransferase n=1 Tax=Steroidobacter flavus TaxID=1842136 RepID=A0ABV8T014_9GAMM
MPVRNGMVTGTTGSTAIEGGVEILKAGGSAADAALATALTQVCMAAGSWVSYAGIMTMVYFDASTGTTYNLNAGYNTVAAETDPLNMPGVDLAKLINNLTATDTYTPSGRTALVPGFMAGIEAAHERFGKLPRTKIFEPAIRCAEQGFEWSRGLTAQYAYRKDVLGRLPETKAVYTKPDGSAYQPGETFKQPALAGTLRQVAEQGADYMYKGPWAKKLIAALQRDGGRMTLDDLANYRVIWAQPLHTAYHGFDIYVHGLPASGGVDLIEAMNLAEVSQLSKLGRYSQSPEAMFTLAQIAKPALMFSYSKPETFEPLGLDRALEARVTKQSAAKIWELMRAGKMPMVPAMAKMPVHSDAIIAIDRWGNIATVCHSINAVSWGASGINVEGVSIPDSASFQRDDIAKIKPGSRLPDPSNPGLIVRNGKPFMGFSSIGAGLHLRTLGALVNVIDFGMTPQQAINEPSLGMFVLGAPGETTPPLAIGAKDFSPAFIERVGELGQKLVENDSLRGYWLGIQVDQKTGELHGGAIRELAVGGRAVGY